MLTAKQEGLVTLIERLKQNRDRLQKQLNEWIARGFRGGGKTSSEDATREATASKVGEVADLDRQIAEQEAKEPNA